MMSGEIPKEEAFKHKIGGYIASGFICYGLALGVRHNLFKELQEKAPNKNYALTSKQLAELTQCKPRYVREWVNGMVCSGVVDHTEEDGQDKYWIEEYRAGGLKMAYRSLLVMAGLQYEKLVSNCFPVDGPSGTQLEDHIEVHKFLKTHPIWGTDDDVSNLLSWYPEVESLLSSGVKVIEVGCGGAYTSKGFAKRFPQSTFYVTDLSPHVLEGAKQNCAGLANVSYGVLDACNIPRFMENLFDIVLVCDVLHDVAFPEKLAAGLSMILKPGKLLVLLDIDAHEKVADNLKDFGVRAGGQYILSLLYCVPTSLSTPGAAALGACAGVEQMSRILASNGFSEVKDRKVNEKNVLFVARK